jgi:hypothetical protein
MDCVDPCPATADGGVDFDGDGVGDACDPRPWDTGDRIVLFDPFTSQDPSWQVIGGQWTWGEDEVFVAGVDSGQLIVHTGVDVLDVRVDVRGTIDNYNAGTSNHNFGVLTWADTAGNGEQCDGYGNGAFSWLAMHQVSGNSAGGWLTAASLTFTVNLGDPFELRQLNYLNEVRCKLYGNGGEGETLPVSARAALTGRHIGLRATRFAATVTSIVVYEVGL